MLQRDKEDLAFRLYNEGVRTDHLAERFGVKRPAIGRWIRNAKLRFSNENENDRDD